MNIALIQGRLGQDPELKTAGQSQVANFSVATSKKWTDKNGQKQEKTEWHKCQAWGKTGETIAKFFNKGDGITIQGEIQTRSWETDAGEKRYITEIRVERFFFVPSSKGSEKIANDFPEPAIPPGTPNMAPSFDANEDMPF